MGLADDILFKVGFDIDETTTSFDILKQGIDILSKEAQKAQAAFADFEQEAAALGTSVERLAGITHDTANAYRDLRTQQEGWSRDVDRLRVSVLSPVIKEQEEWNRSLRQTLRALIDLDSAGLSNAFSFGGKRAIRPTVGELQARAREETRFGGGSVESAIANRDATRQADKILEDFAELRLQTIERAQESQRALFARAQQANQFAQERRQLFDQNQQINRRAFIERQALSSGLDQTSLTPAAVQAERRRVALAQLDVGQRAAGERRTLSDELQSRQSLKRLETQSQTQIQRLTRMLTTLEQIRDQRAFEGGARVEELVDDMVE